MKKEKRFFVLVVLTATFVVLFGGKNILYAADYVLKKPGDLEKYLEYAYLSNDVYGDGENDLGDYKRIDELDESLASTGVLSFLKSSGFKASTYINEEKKEIVVAFAGTNEGKDWVQDFAAMMVTSNQHSDALNYIASVFDYKSDHKDLSQYKVSVTGHSLGGGLAQTVGAALGLKTVTFNTAAVSFGTGFALGDINDSKIVNIIMNGDIVNSASKINPLGLPSGKNYGSTIIIDFNTEAVTKNLNLKDAIWKVHGMDLVIASITNSVISKKASGFLLQNYVSGLSQVSNSHIGTPVWQMTALNSAVNPSNPANAQQQTGYQQGALSSNSVAYGESGWQVVSGNYYTHYSEGNRFGSIAAPAGGVISALNNAGVYGETVMQKTFYVPKGVKQVTVSFNANFVTNEYPVWVGSQYNDKAKIDITTGSGNTYKATVYNKALNSSNFKNVSGLPSPMSSSGGQTGFDTIKKTIPVANGGNVVVTVKTQNVGDGLVPSATLINKISAK